MESTLQTVSNIANILVFAFVIVFLLVRLTKYRFGRSRRRRDEISEIRDLCENINYILTKKRKHNEQKKD